MKWKVKDLKKGGRYSTGRQGESDRLICWYYQLGWFAVDEEGTVVWRHRDPEFFCATLTSIGAMPVFVPVKPSEIKGGFVRGDFEVFESKGKFALLYLGQCCRVGDREFIANFINEKEAW